MERVKEIVREGVRVGNEDPRTIIHGFKVGLALVVVSSFYYYQPFGPFTDYFGINAMWAVMTVVVVFEFSVGATLGKGLNRGVATLVAGGLGIGAHELARLSGAAVEPILLVMMVFVLAALSTFVRFFPGVKKRFDYLVLIFILTFALISLSKFKDEEILDLAESRLSTVVIGGISCILISVFVCPVWAGQDLHTLLASNLDIIAHFLQDFGDEYFEAREDGDYEVVEKRRTNLERYKSIIDSKSEEEALANFAEWEPRHGQFRYRHPWKQYLAVGALLRQCAYRIDALNSYINSDIQIPMTIKKKLETPIRRIASESGKSMKEVAISLKKMRKPSSSDIHVSNSQSACKALSTLLTSGILNDDEPLHMISLLTITSLLIDIVNLTQKISESVHELASAARFKKQDDQADRTIREAARSWKNWPCHANQPHEDEFVVTVLNDVDTSSNNDDDNSLGESSENSYHDHHVTVKIVDDNSDHEKNLDGETHVHKSLLKNVGRSKSLH